MITSVQLFRKLSLLCLGVLLSTNLLAQTNLAVYNFNGTGVDCTNPTKMGANTVASNMSADAVNVTSLTCVTSTGNLTLHSHTTDASVNTGMYFEVKIRANAGYKFNVTSISYQVLRQFSGTSPVSFRVAHNGSGSFTSFKDTTFLTTNTANNTVTWTLPSTYTSSSGGELTIRIYGWGAVGATAAARLARYDNLTVIGSVDRDPTVVANVTGGGIAASPLTATQTNKAVLGWSMTNASGPTFSAININASNSLTNVFNNIRLVRSVDNDLGTTGDNTDLTATSTIDASSGNVIEITNILPAQILTGPSGIHYFILVDIDASVNGSTPNVQLSFTDADVTVIGTGTIVSPVTVTGTDYAFVGPPIINISEGYFYFGEQINNTVSAEQSFTVDALNLTDNLVITPPVGYEIRTGANAFSSSPIILTPVSGTVAPTVIDVRFAPTVPGPYFDFVISSSTGAEDQYLIVDGSSVTAEPTVQPSLSFSNITGNSVDVTITPGDGQKHLLVIRQGSAVNAAPDDINTYNASTVYGGGSQVGSLNYVVVAGATTVVTVTGLSGNTAYHFAVYAYNDDGVSGAENYLTTSPGLGNITTTGASYVWNATGSASWATASSWTPSRTSPASTDVLIFNSGNTVTATNIPTQTIAQLSVSNNSNVTLVAASGGAVLTLGGGTGTDLSIASGTTLTLSSTNALTITLNSGVTLVDDGTLDVTTNQFNGTGSATINGTVITSRINGFSGATSRAFSSTLTSVVLGASSTVIYNGSIAQAVSARSDYANLAFSGAGTKTLPGSTVSVQKDFTVSGGSVLVTSGNVMQFNGSNAQNVAGIAFRSATFSGGNTKTLTSAATVSGIVNLSGNTTLASNGNLTLTSDASSTGRIGIISDASTVSGNVIVQRYIPSGGRLWYNLASPVSGATIAEWQSGAPTTGIYITGNFTGASAPVGVGIASTGVSMNLWDATTGAYSAYPTSSSAAPITNGVGYRVYVRDGNAAYNGGVTSAKTIHSTGSLVIGDKTFTLNYSPNGGSPAGGWNFLGNPYASDITANLNNSAAWNITSANLTSTAVYTSNSQNNNYLSCNGGVGAGCNISSTHGFWVQTNAGGGSLVIHEGAKKDTSSTLSREVVPNHYVVSIYPVGYESYKDELFVRYDDDATLNFDPSLDAYELAVAGTSSTASVQVYSVENGVNYSIEARPDFVEADTVDLKITGPVGQNAFDFSQVQNFSSDVTIYLWDKFLNTITDVSTQPVYTFDILSGNAASTGARFSIINTRQSVVTPVVNPAGKGSVYAYPNPSSGAQDVIVNGTAAGNNYSLVIYSNNGIKVYEQNGVTGTTTVNSSSFATGLYMIKVISADGENVFTEKFIKE